MSCEIEVRVTPRASRNKVEAGDGVVKIWVTAAPTDGQANEAVITLLAKALGIAPSRLQIVRGESARDKLIRIEALTLSDVRSRIR